MNKLGEYLRSLRECNHYSLKDVQDRTAITDTKLSRIEKGVVNEASPSALKKLANLYNKNVIDFFIMADFLDEIDLINYTKVFDGVDLLTEAERNNIQEQIYLLNKRSLVQEGESHDI